MTETSRRGLHDTVACITRDDFIRERVAPALNGDESRVARLVCPPSIVHDTGTGRVTLRYDFGSGRVVYGKLYTDALGEHSYRVLRSLWNAPMNARSRFQVSEPLAFLADQNLLLTRAVGGQTIASLLRPDSAIDVRDAGRRAARWLVALHCSSIRLGQPEADWDSLKLFRIAVRLMKAAAANPDESIQLLEMVAGLKESIRRMPLRRPVVQTHGRYHHDHVYVGETTTAVIDFDRSRPSDPAKDVAEFMRVTRIAGFRAPETMDRATAATDAFLAEYLSCVPEAAAGLSYHWAAYLVLSLLGLMKRLRPDDPRRRPLIDFHLNELKRAQEFTA